MSLAACSWCKERALGVGFENIVKFQSQPLLENLGLSIQFNHFPASGDLTIFSLLCNKPEML